MMDGLEHIVDAGARWPMAKRGLLNGIGGLKRGERKGSGTNDTHQRAKESRAC